MQTLGLASEQKPTDGMFKRLFWPTIENEYDLDLVSQQGFWVCVAVALLSLLLSSFTGHAITGVFVAITFLLAATGVRQRSIGAAILIFLCYLIDRVSAMVFGVGGAGVVPFVSIMLLFANVRATLLAKRWKERGPVQDSAERVEPRVDTFTEKLANLYPAKVWPIGRFVFYPLASALLLITIVGMVMLPSIERKQAELQRQQQDDQIIAVQPAK